MSYERQYLICQNVCAVLERLIQCLIGLSDEITHPELLECVQTLMVGYEAKAVEGCQHDPDCIITGSPTTGGIIQFLDLLRECQSLLQAETELDLTEEQALADTEEDDTYEI